VSARETRASECRKVRISAESWPPRVFVRASRSVGRETRALPAATYLPRSGLSERFSALVIPKAWYHAGTAGRQPASHR
jgi:hypothetical protein